MFRLFLNSDQVLWIDRRHAGTGGLPTRLSRERPASTGVVLVCRLHRVLLPRRNGGGVFFGQFAKGRALSSRVHSALRACRGRVRRKLKAKLEGTLRFTITHTPRLLSCSLGTCWRAWYWPGSFMASLHRRVWTRRPAVPNRSTWHLDDTCWLWVVVLLVLLSVPLKIGKDLWCSFVVTFSTDPK